MWNCMRRVHAWMWTPFLAEDKGILVRACKPQELTRFATEPFLHQGLQYGFCSLFLKWKTWKTLVKMIHYFMKLESNVLSVASLGEVLVSNSRIYNNIDQSNIQYSQLLHDSEWVLWAKHHVLTSACNMWLARVQIPTHLWCQCTHCLSTTPFMIYPLFCCQNSRCMIYVDNIDWRW